MDREVPIAEVRRVFEGRDREGALERKESPVFTGFVKYFPDAIIEVARLSFKANEQHNPGTAMHWDRSKSGDEKDALMRHLVEAGHWDNDGIRHSAKVAWRAMANLQKEIEEARNPNPKLIKGKVG